MEEKTRKKLSEIKKKNIDHNKVETQKLVKEIQDKTKDLLLPSVRDKMNKVAELIKDKIGKNNGLTASQILPLITKRSVSDIACITTKGYTAYELGEALNIYIDMI